MACTSCKNKKEFKEELEKTTEFVTKGVIWFALVWTLLGGYGLITLIKKIFF